MKIEFKNGFAVIDGIETLIPEATWKSPELEKYRAAYKKGFDVAAKLLIEGQKPKRKAIA